MPGEVETLHNRSLPLCLFVLAACVAIGPVAAEEPRAEVLLEAEVTAGSIPRPEFGRERADERERMVRDQVGGRGVEDRRVLEALMELPRHEFVPSRQRDRAYADTPLPIGHGQTISQPYIVGFMTERLELEGDERVLEVGTGSAYQAAVLALLVDHVVSIEIIEPLARSAAERLRRLDFRNITVLHGDGYYGHEAAAPYDAIIVTAAAEHIPPPLLSQLKPGGRMVIPVGRSGWTQNLLLVEKTDDGEVSTRNLMAVRFVPLTGER